MKLGWWICWNAFLLLFCELAPVKKVYAYLFYFLLLDFFTLVSFAFSVKAVELDDDGGSGTGTMTFPVKFIQVQRSKNEAKREKVERELASCIVGGSVCLREM